MVDLTTTRRTSRRLPRALVAVGAALLLFGLVVFGALFVRGIDGYRWPEGSSVPQDGASHLVDVDPDKTFHLWVFGIYGSADCTATEAASGDAVPLQEPSSDRFRNGGAVHYEALRSGRSASGQISVTCAAIDQGQNPAPVYVDELNGPALVDDLGPQWPIPAGLAAAGAALLLAAGAMRILRRT